MSADFEPLTEDEVWFCWRGLVDHGQLSVPKLQKFMLEVCGEKVSPMQAYDLLSYMDADDDDVVSKEDFRNFVSIGRLDDTDAKNFMWTPKTGRKGEGEEGRSGFNQHTLAPCAGLQATANMFSSRRCSAESSADPTSSMSLPFAAAPAVHSKPQPTETPAKAAPTSHSTVPPMVPHPPPGKRNGPGRTAHVTGASALLVPHGSHASTAKDHQHREEERAASPPVVINPPEKKKPPPIDQKTLERIDAALKKYEDESWEKFKAEEEAFQKKLFQQFTAPDATEMTIAEYHRMLMKWHKLARLFMPSDLRPADSLATLEYMIRREQEGRAGASGEDGDEDGDKDATLGAAEPKLSYKLWQEFAAGKYRPEEHITQRVLTQPRVFSK